MYSLMLIEKEFQANDYSLLRGIPDDMTSGLSRGVRFVGKIDPLPQDFQTTYNIMHRNLNTIYHLFKQKNEIAILYFRGPLTSSKMVTVLGCLFDESCDLMPFFMGEIYNVEGGSGYVDAILHCVCSEAIIDRIARNQDVCFYPDITVCMAFVDADKMSSALKYPCYQSHKPFSIYKHSSSILDFDPDFDSFIGITKMWESVLERISSVNIH